MNLRHSLPSILLTSHPPSTVRSMLLGATRCYVHGLFQGTAVLTRSTMEAALEDPLRTQRATAWQLADLAARSGSPDTLRRLLGRARAARLISHEMFERLDDVRAVGSRAAHGQIVSPEAARTVLLTARDLVQRLQAWEDDDSLVVGNRPPGLHVCGMAAISRSTSSFVRYSTDEPPEAA